MAKPALFLLASMTLATTPASADTSHELYGVFGNNAWPTPEFGFHSIALLGWKMKGLPGGTSLSAVVNVETLIVQLDDLCFADGMLCARTHIKGEYGLSGLLADYYKRGEKLDERGFGASHVEVLAALKANLPHDQYLDYRLTGRKWFFDATEKTSSDLVLPPNAWVLEQRLAYTYWGIESDPSLYEWHRTLRRIRGFGFGAEIGLEFRDQARRWGAPLDPRNDPETWIVMMRQWLRWGWQTTPWLRIQAAEWAGWGRGEDDLTRARIGGTNPYVVPIIGVPWAAFLSDKFVAGELSAHFPITGEVEAGVLVDAAYIQDLRRRGRDSFGPVIGIGAFVDARLGSWQIDFAGGWSPPLAWQRDTPHFSLFVSLGKRIF